MTPTTFEDTVYEPWVAEDFSSLRADKYPTGICKKGEMHTKSFHKTLNAERPSSNQDHHEI